MRKKKRTIQLIVMMTALLIAVSSSFMMMNSYTKMRDVTQELQLRENQDAQYYSRYNVLFISSYAPEFMTVPMQLRGLQSVFRKHKISIIQEYMRSRLLHGKESGFYFHIKDVLKAEKRAGVNIDAVVAGGDEALTFVKKNQHTLFKGMPICFMGVNNRQAAIKAVKDPQITGSYSPDHIRETLTIATKLQPSAENIVCLYDETVAGLQNKRNFFVLKKYFKGKHFIGIDMGKYDLAGWTKRISQLDAKRDIVLYMSSYVDRNGHNYTIPETIKLLNDYCHAPVYRTRDNGQGSGVIGGVVYDTFYESQLAGKRIVDVIINHHDISKMRLFTNTHHQIEFDANILKKYHLDQHVLPTNTHFLNQPDNLNSFTFTLMAGIAIIVALILLMIMEERSYYAYERAITHLEYLNHHDDLTNMYSRAYAIEMLEKACLKHDGTLVMLDLDNFTMINDTYGHDKGDLVIKEVGTRLNNYGKAYGLFCARLSGDEYLVYYDHVIDSEELRHLRRAITRDMNIGHDQVHIGVSLGAALHQRGITAGELMTNADVALAHAKREGKNTMVFYNNAMKENITEEERIKEYLIEALRHDGFEMVYQPKVDPSNDLVIGYEALVRLKDRRYSPDIFIPIAESNGLISELSRQITEKVIKQLALWQKAGEKLYPVSINYSPAQIYDRGYVAYLAQTLSKYHIDARYLRVEITESLMMEDMSATNKLFEDFAHLGILTLIDDFGTGYSSLSYLMHLPISIVKIDKSFIDHYLVPGKESFIENMIKMLKDLDKLIVVEGVEEKWQKDKLNEYGVDAIQGYFYSKPLLPDDVLIFQHQHQ